MPQIVTLYKQYLAHLQLLQDKKFISNFEDKYICPICLQTFSKEQLDKLSLEDAPQASLGGHRIAITCKYCNNNCGSEIDYQLINYITKLDQRDFIERSDRDVKIFKKEEVVNAILKVNSNKELTLRIPRKINKPQLFESIIGLKEGEIIDIQNKQLRVDIRNVSAAILKNAYIILFAKFGYTFLLDTHYDRIREQILNPEKHILPDLWTRQPISPIIPDGIYLSNNNQYRGFFVIFSCKYTSIRIHRFCVCIPTPMMPYEMIHQYFKNYIPDTPIYMQNISGDYLMNIENIARLKNWVYNWNMRV